MKPKIIVKDKEHLKKLIEQEIESNGLKCDLNHLDVSNVTDMSKLFWNSAFSGDISNWDVSQVKNMEYMFVLSSFNGEISNWNVSNVTNMKKMFHSCYFRGDLSGWKPNSLENNHTIFSTSSIAPYWTKFDNKEERNRAIEKYHLPNELNNNLPFNDVSKKKLKI